MTERSGWESLLDIDHCCALTIAICFDDDSDCGRIHLLKVAQMMRDYKLYVLQLAMLCYAVLCACHLTERAAACCAMLYCAMLCCAVLCYDVLCCAVLCYAVLCCAMLCYAMLCYAVTCA